MAQAEVFQRQADDERGLMQKDDDSYSSRIQDLQNEASRLDDEANTAVEEAEKRKQAAIVAAAAAVAADSDHR